jgi:2-oxo-3-hexenedioate decarboxylase
MALETGTIFKLAEQLEDAELQAYDVTMITADYPDMDWDDADPIQDEIRRRKEARGSKITGLKAGRTVRPPS